MPKLFLAALIFSILLGGTHEAAQAYDAAELFNQETSKHIESLLGSVASEASPTTGVARLLSHDGILRLYEERGFSPLWFAGWQLKPAASVLLDSLRGAGAHGLCSDDYLLVQLEGLSHLQESFARNNLPMAPQKRATLDLFLSQAFLTFASHLVEGQVDPRLAHVDWRARQRKVDLIRLLGYAVDSGRLRQVLEGLYPPHMGYRDLLAALARYQEISALGGWPTILPGPTICPGDRDHRVSQLKELLQKQ